ncbi:MAG: hypothetical protein ACM3QZ_01380 [Solirubrobacterales bacterium]
MITIQVDEKDAAVLKETLTKYLTELKREIARTEKKDFLENLRAEESVMKKLLEQL